MCVYNVYVCAQITSCRFATGRQKYETFFFRNNFYKEALARAPIPHARKMCICICIHIHIYTYICTLVMPFPRAASAVSSAVCTRALLISSKYETSKTIVPSTIPLSPFALSVSPRQPGGEKSRGIFKFRGRSPSFCPPSLLRYISFTLLLRPRFMLVPWKIGMARDNYKKIFFRVKGGKGGSFLLSGEKF